MKTSLYNQDGSLHPEAQFLLSFKSSNMSIGDWKKRMKAFKSQLSEEDLKEFERLKKNKISSEWHAAKRQAQRSIGPVTKVSLYEQDGSLHLEAQFFMGLRIDTLPTKEEQRVVRLRLKHFMDRLSKEDLKVFKKIKRRELDRLRQMRYRDNNREKVREAGKKRGNSYMPKWNAANPEKAKARSDRYVAKRAAKRFQERLEKYPEFYAGWVDEEAISLHKEDGTLFCDSIHLLILSNPENVPKRDWVEILKDFRSKLRKEDAKLFDKLRRKERDLKFRTNNPEKVKATRQKTRSKPSYIEWEKSYKPAYDAEYYAKNSKKIIANTSVWQKEKKKTDPLYAAQCKLRKAVHSAFDRIKKNKPAKTLELLGCTWEEAKYHIESLFQEGMTWENHGVGDDKWHIDHIRPVCSFEDHELHLMNHISNLRPLWQKDNLSKIGNDRKQSVRNKAKESSDIIQESHILEKTA